MPARTGKVTYVPGKGSYTRGKSGKAKSFSGKGPAPSGSVKTPEATAATAPTVTVSTTGNVTTSGFGSKKAARQAQRAQERRQRRRTTAILNTHLEKPEARPYDPNPITAVISSKPRETPTHGTLADGDWKFTKAQLHPHGEEGQITGKVKGGEWAEVPGKPGLQFDDKTALVGEINRSREKAGKRQLKVTAKGNLATPKILHQVSARVRRLQAKARRAGGPLPGLGSEESHVARKVLRQGERKGADYKELLAAAETGLVESGFKNLRGGDADSEGWRQERRAYYPNPTNVKASANRFFTETKTDTGGQRGRGETAGQLAQTVQASAYPERYDERKPEANAIVKGFLKGRPNPKLQAKLQAAEAEASKLGLKIGGQGSVGPAPKKLVSRVVVAEHAMREVEGTPYAWGGGHQGFTAAGGLDCSGAVSYVVHKVAPNLLKAPLSSGSMGSVLKPGPGALTVFYNPTHTFLRLINKKGEAEYWGTSVGDSGEGGLTRHPAPSPSYLAQYNVGHVPGMGKKQALQLGAPLAAIEGGGSFAGMSFSSSGTTATISGSAATITGEPGFSKKPIKLTARQVLNRTNRKLKALSATVPPKDSSGTGSGAVSIADLERKYGRAAV